MTMKNKRNICVASNSSRHDVRYGSEERNGDKRCVRRSATIVTVVSRRRNTLLLMLRFLLASDSEDAQSLREPGDQIVLQILSGLAGDVQETLLEFAEVQNEIRDEIQGAVHNEVVRPARLLVLLRRTDQVRLRTCLDW